MARAVYHCGFERFGVRKAETLRRNSRGSSPDAADLRALETQIVHQSLLMMKAMVGLVRVSVSMEPPAPTVTTTIDPSTPTFQP